MKKAISILLILILSISLIGCGKTMCSVEGCENQAIKDKTFEEDFCSKHLANEKAFVSSKAAYDNVGIAYRITEQFGSDIYEAWRLGIYEDDAILGEGVKFLATKLSLSEEDLGNGVAYVMNDLLGLEWSELTEEDRKAYAENATLFFSMMEDNLFSFCVMVVVGSYKTNGKVEEAETALDLAKTQMKELSDKYSDYEHYPNLKEYYTTTSSFFDFCQDPTGSFEQVKDTINDYENNIRDYISDLDYIFEE